MHCDQNAIGSAKLGGRQVICILRSDHNAGTSEKTRTHFNNRSYCAKTLGSYVIIQMMYSDTDHMQVKLQYVVEL